MPEPIPRAILVGVDASLAAHGISVQRGGMIWATVAATRRAGAVAIPFASWEAACDQAVAFALDGTPNGVAPVYVAGPLRGDAPAADFGCRNSVPHYVRQPGPLDWPRIWLVLAALPDRLMMRAAGCQEGAAQIAVDLADQGACCLIVSLDLPDGDAP